MTISNEPGYYEPGEFGIRIESLFISHHVKTKNNFAGKQFLGFEPATFAPIKTNMINIDQLDNDELEWLNHYHQQVRDTLLPDMEKYFPEAVEYLIEETKPLHKHF
jgi:Xaa-Pro aminopeptidase